VKFEKARIPKNLTIKRSQFAHFNPYQFLSSEIAKPFHALIEIVTEPRIIFEPKEEETTFCVVKIKSAMAQPKFFPKIDVKENFFKIIIENDLKFDKIGWKSTTVEIKRSVWHSFNVHAHLNEMALYYDVEVEMPDVKPEPAQDDVTMVVIKMLTPEPKKDRFPLLINNGEISIRVLNDIPGPLVKMTCQNGQYQPGMDEFVLVKFTRSGWLDTKTCLCLSNGDDIIFQKGQVEVMHRLAIDDDTPAGTIITISVQEVYGLNYPKQDPNFDSIKIAVGLDKDYVSIPSEIIVMSSDIVAKGGIYIDIKRLEDFDLSEHIEPTIGKIEKNKLIIPFNLAQLFQSSNQEHVINNKLFLTRSGKKVIKLENNRCKIIVKNDTVKIRLARTYRHPEVKQSDGKIMLEVQTNCLGRVLVVRCIQLGYLCEFKDNERVLSVPVSQEPMDDVGQDLVISVHKKIEGKEQITGEIHDSDCLDACQVHLLWDLKPIELTLAVDDSLPGSSKSVRKVVNQAAESVTFYIRRNRYFDVPINVLVKVSGFMNEDYYLQNVTGSEEQLLVNIGNGVSKQSSNSSNQQNTDSDLLTVQLFQPDIYNEGQDEDLDEDSVVIQKHGQRLILTNSVQLDVVKQQIVLVDVEGYSATPMLFIGPKRFYSRKPILMIDKCIFKSVEN